MPRSFNRVFQETDGIPQLKMRGSRNRPDDRGDGEVDENFWAQAAADQAAGHNRDDGDDS